MIDINITINDDSCNVGDGKSIQFTLVAAVHCSVFVAQRTVADTCYKKYSQKFQHSIMW